MRVSEAMGHLCAGLVTRCAAMRLTNGRSRAVRHNRNQALRLRGQRPMATSANGGAPSCATDAPPRAAKVTAAAIYAANGQHRRESASEPSGGYSWFPV